MAYDRVYYYDKINYHRHTLGEVQTNFNCNIVIDGSKDSMQIDVHSYSRDALQPNTIILHPTDPLQWWVVKKDNVKRNMNEQGFYYIHSITLNGAIDLLKNRDLTDCGMNANNYTIDTFFKKLLKLSNFEFEYQINYGNNVDPNKKVDYIKSYENYTLLSAIRDFFNGYNCDVKLGFQTGAPQNRIIKAIFVIVPRTGNIDLETIDIDEFDDVRESIDFDKESYGTTVISNAQNVISTQAKTYPQVGGVKLTGSDYETTMSSAYIKLPTPAWKVNWVKAIPEQRMSVYYGSNYIYSDKFYFGDNEKSIEDALEDLKVKISQHDFSPYDEEEQQLLDWIDEHENEIKELARNSTITFYNNPSYNPRINYPSDSTYGSIVKEENTPYIAVLISTNLSTYHQVALMDKESAGLLRNTNLALTWERGSEKIEGFGAFSGDYVPVANNNGELTDAYIKLGHYRLNTGVGSWLFTTLSNYYGNTVFYQVIGVNTCFQVNYIPMSDLKVKQDNENNNNDIQLYNQNGKLNDSVALSKMIDSYSKEIENPTITRYMHYTNLNDIPRVGQMVIDNDKKYVINNISMNFYPNESDSLNSVGYFIDCEFSLCEYVSTKSIMTSPNTNVRDYGIPQKYNIKRRQTYRDYYEFDFLRDRLANEDTPYTNLQNYLNFNYLTTINDFDHTALIKIDYESQIGSPLSKTWYYQLNSTAYTMAKSVYEVIDFDDNNIIGYDIQNSTTGFNMSDLWSNQYRAVTTPVSYVDDNGKFVGITLQMVGKDNLEKVYSSIDTQGESVMFSAHCFIDKTIYDNSGSAESETIEDEKEYTTSLLAPAYLYFITIDLDEIGIPGDIEINADTFVGFVDATFLANDNVIVPISFVPYNFNYGDRQIVVLATFNNPASTFGSLTGTLSASFKIKYLDEENGLADYVIKESNYEKDAIEVPVFEYSLQIGDTKNVEVGDNILLNRECICSPLNCVVRDNEITVLNATKYLGDIGGDMGQYDPVEDKRQYEVVVGYYPHITFEDNNTKIRIKFYDHRAFYINGNQDQTVFSFDIAQDLSQYQVSKNAFVGKDIIIYKNSIKSLYRDDVEETVSVDFDRDLMMIIHKPKASQFEGDDLVFYINYYKLR